MPRKQRKKKGTRRPVGYVSVRSVLRAEPDPKRLARLLIKLAKAELAQRDGSDDNPHRSRP